MSDLDNILAVFRRGGRAGQFLVMMTIGAALGILLAYAVNTIGQLEAAQTAAGSGKTFFPVAPPARADHEAGAAARALPEDAHRPYCAENSPKAPLLDRAESPEKCQRHTRVQLDERARFSPAPDETSMPASPRPRIAIIIDDMTSDPDQIRRVSALPGPLTLSFLPYSKALSTKIAEVTEKGHGVMLHLPMEAVAAPGEDHPDPGPDALYVSQDTAEIEARIQRNLDRFEGYTGVNNHMGSRFTAQYDKMRIVMKVLKSRGLFFLDSVTSGSSAASAAAKAHGTPFLARDVFLDAVHAANDAAFVRAQLGKTEDIARTRGYAIAIAHPHPVTLNTLGPWLVSAYARGFEIVTIDRLIATAPHPPAGSITAIGPDRIGTDAISATVQSALR